MAKPTEPWCTSIVEFFQPLKPGDSVSVGGKMALVYEVRRLASKSTPIAGVRRPLYAVLHAGSGSALITCTSVGKRQREWHLTPAQITKLKRAGDVSVAMPEVR